MIKKTLSRRNTVSFPSCFRPATVEPPSAATATTNLTTCMYHTRLGIFALTWSHTFFGRNLQLHLLPSHRSLSLPTATVTSSSFRLSLNSILFWKKQGSQKLNIPSSSSPATVIWDLSRAKFGSGPEPESGFYIAVILDSELILLVGDLKPGTGFEPGSDNQQALVVRREHVHGTKLHRTKTLFGGKTRAISIECDDSDPDPKLIIYVDDTKVVQVKHLKWKFRGSQRIEVDGQPILLSWDVYNWLFDDQAEKGEGFALFTFRFEIERGDEVLAGGGERMVVTEEVPAERGWRKKNGLRMKARSASSSSLSSASSSACGSVLDWESVEETELKGPTGFSLLVSRLLFVPTISFYLYPLHDYALRTRRKWINF